MADKIRVLLTEKEVDERINEVAELINRDYEGKHVHLICILKGGVFFTCELAKRLTVPVSMDFMSVSSYGDGTSSSGVVKIAKDLDETLEGKDVLVEDYTMDAAGSLSQMKLAGGEQSILDTYVAEHQKLAEEQTLRITETKIRELSEEELVREDQNSIPVICMGYYGGWCGDPEELCDQIQHILDTYTQKDKYLILGLYPSWVQDREAYHEEMTSRWGEHYFQLDDVIRNAASSDKGRQEIAEAIYQRLTEMEYV